MVEPFSFPLLGKHYSIKASQRAREIKVILVITAWVAVSGGSRVQWRWQEGFLGEESAVEGGEGSLLKLQPVLGLLCEAEAKAVVSLPCRSSSSWVVVSFSVLEVHIQFTQRGTAYPGHCTCRSSSNSLEEWNGFGVGVSGASDMFFGGVFTVRLDLGQRNIRKLHISSIATRIQGVKLK